MKYDFEEVNLLYFAFIASVHNQKDINFLCLEKFGEQCGQLGQGELKALQDLIFSGVARPILNFNKSYDKCFPDL
ncbi:hypothetical protein D3C87_175450 [compost metagenome]